MDLHTLNLTSIAGLTAIGAIVATTWRYIAQIGRYFVGLFIGCTVIKDAAGAAVMSYSFSRAIRSPIGLRVFGGFDTYLHPKRRSETVAFEGISSDPILIKFGRQFAFVSTGNLGNSEDVGYIQNRNEMVRVRYLRWFFDIEKFTNEAVEHYNEQKRQTRTDGAPIKRHAGRFRITRYTGRGNHYGEESKTERGRDNPSPASYPSGHAEIDVMIQQGLYRLLKWQREDLRRQPEEGQSAFTGYPFPDEVGEAIKELELWMTHETWFRSKSIPWRRGWLLYGEPGTGKSTLIRALGMSFDLPVFVFDLAGMSNDDLCKSWDDMMTNTPCIALIEDIDNIFDGRTYVGSTTTNTPHVTFDCLLNCISGVKQADGVFLTITTNHIGKVDAAIGVPDESGRSSRPGRIDKAIYLGKMAKPQRTVLAKHILSDFPELIDTTVEDGEGETAAQFQARCADLALARFWKDKKKLATDVPPTYVEAVHINNHPRVVDAKTFEERPATKAEISRLYGKMGKDGDTAKSLLTIR